MIKHDTTDSATQPTILSMEVDDDDSYQSEYRVRIGNQVKYLVVAPGTFDRDTLSLPLGSLPRLPCDEEWTVAYISRDKTSGGLKTSLTNHTLAGVENQWHHTTVDCFELERTKQITGAAFEAICHSVVPVNFSSATPIIVKMARFEWEVPRIEQETRAYQLLEGSGLAPRFLAHVHENGRVIGFLLEKLEGRFASLHDLDNCKAALGKLHRLGLLHGDVNRYNFLVTDDGVKLVDFENSQEDPDPELMRNELKSLPAKLVDESGLGGGFIFTGDDV
ncbi:hypothetical protein RJ55_07455 [Drechmeria coniospora]|nr:hypothetical protein RJ55_07455 [Drechmeria coniospora]